MQSCANNMDYFARVFNPEVDLYDKNLQNVNINFCDRRPSLEFGSSRVVVTNNKWIFFATVNEKLQSDGKKTHI